MYERTGMAGGVTALARKSSADDNAIAGLGGLGSLNGTIAAPKGQLLSTAAAVNRRRPGAPLGKTPAVASGAPVAGSVAAGAMLPAGAAPASLTPRDGRPRILSRPQSGAGRVLSRPTSGHGGGALPTLPSVATSGELGQGLGLNMAALKAPEFDDEIDDDELAREEEEMLARLRAAQCGGAPPSATNKSSGVSVAAATAPPMPRAAPAAPKPMPPAARAVALSHDDLDDLSDEELA